MTAEILLSPALILILGAAVLGVLPSRLRSPFFVLLPMVALVVLWNYSEADKLSLVFGTIFAMIASISGIYAYHIKDNLQQISAMIYAGGAIGVILAQDYYTLFVFWELMAVSSTYLVWANRTKESQEAGMRYLAAHIFGGGLLFAGILLLVSETGSTLITSLPDAYSLSSVLILMGVALNTAIPPLNAWLPDAYPRATITGAVFMSAFTTKSAVYVLMRIFPGWEILIWLGVVMALYGVVYAVLANDILQILSYHIISQVGFMVAGVGIGTEMALNGTAAHAFSHILYKSLLFMGAGTVLFATGTSKLTGLGGIASKMKIPLFLYMIGAFSISGFPLFNGFISKSMIVSAAGESHLEIAMLLLLLASVGTFLSIGLKLPYFTWFGKSKSEISVAPVPNNMLYGMGLGAFFCTLYGVYPDLLYRILPYEVAYNPFTIYHFVEIIQIAVFTFVGFWILRKKLESQPSIALDTDWFYRRSASLVSRVFVSGVSGVFDASERAVKRLTDVTIQTVNGSGARSETDMYRILSGVLIVFVLLGLLLVFS